MLADVRFEFERSRLLLMDPSVRDRCTFSGADAMLPRCRTDAWVPDQN
jgi:hypothetical protein